MIKEFFKQKVLNDRFVRSVLTLIGGAITAQAIPILISPVISRIYEVEDFGVFSVYMSIVAMISIIATGRYELAVMLPKEDDDAANIIALSTIISFFISILSLTIFWGFNSQITKILGDTRVSKWLYFIPLSVLMGGVYETLNYWTNRKKRYKRLTLSRVSQSAVVSVLNLALGIAGTGISGLIACGLAGQAVAIVVLAWRVIREDKYLIKSISVVRIKSNAVEYQDFPKINSFHAFMDVLQSSGVILLISAFYGNVVLGLYSFTLRILKMPMGLIGSAVGQVFYQQAADIYNGRGDLHKFVKNITKKMCFLALPVFVVLALFSPQIFTVFLGEKWYQAGVYAQIFSPSIFMHFVVSPVSHIPIIVGRQKTAFFIGLVSNAIDVLAVIFGSFIDKSVISGFYLLSFVRTVRLFFILIWYYRISSVVTGDIGVKYRKKVIIIGLPYFVDKLVRNLSDYDKSGSYIGLDMSQGITVKIKYVLHLINADIVYSLEGFAVHSKAAALALFLKKKLVLHWVGSDVLNAKRAYREGLVSNKIIDAATHFSEAVWIQSELEAIGIKSEIVNYSGFDKKDFQISELPKTFSILSYVAKGREEFYGLDKLIRLAGDFPDIEIKIAGISDSQRVIPTNVRLLGWVNSMDEHFKNCVLFLRLMEHDGLSFSVREALANGRYVGYSYEYANVFYINDYEKLRNVVSELYGKFKDNKLPLNQQGIDFIRENFSEHAVLSNLIAKLQEGV